MYFKEERLEITSLFFCLFVTLFQQFASIYKNSNQKQKVFITAMSKKIILLLLILPYFNLYSQLTVESRNFQNNPRVNSIVSCEILVKDNNANIIIPKENIIINERNYPRIIDKIESLADNWQKIYWYPNNDRILTTKDDPLGEYVSRIVVSYQGRVAQSNLLKNEMNTPKMSILSANGNRINIYDYNFGARNIGDSSVFQFYLKNDRPIAINFKENNFGSTRIDSITITGTGFTYLWQGDFFSGTLNAIPPFNMLGTSDNLFDVIFRPTENRYYNELMTFHYQGGAKRQLKLFGNGYTIDYKSKFKLLYPNGGEEFAPCQEIDVKWTGHTIGRSTYIEIRYGTSSWFRFGTTLDSVYRFKLSNLKNENVFIRVGQELEESTPFVMENTGRVNSIGFKSNGTRLVYPKSNLLIEWDLTKSTPTINRQLYMNVSNANLTVKDVKYENNNIISLHNTVSQFGVKSKDTFAIYDETNNVSSTKKVIDEIEIKNLEIDEQKRLIYFVPTLSNKLKTYNLNNSTFTADKIFNYPISTLSINYADNEIIITFMNGDIIFYDKDKFEAGEIEQKRQFNLPDVPIIKNCKISPNGKFLVLGFEYNQNDLFKEINYISLVDAKTGQIFSIRKDSFFENVGLSFSSESNLVVSGYTGDPQILSYDMITGKANKLFVGQSSLTYLAYSPQGSAFAAATNGVSGGATVSYRTYSNAVSDINDAPFKVLIPKSEIKTADFGEELIYTDNIKTLNNIICNQSKAPFFFDLVDGVRLKNGRHFELTNNLMLDTIMPGNCKNITLNFTPKDTGTVVDTLIFKSCENEIYVPLRGIGKSRSVRFISNPILLSEKCIGEKHYLTLELFQNLDTVNLSVSSFEFEQLANTNFKILYPTQDTIIAPNGILTVRIEYLLDTLGTFNPYLRTYHNNQNKYYFQNIFNVKGIGTYIDLSHKILPFTLEDRIRKVKLENLSLQNVFISDYVLSGVSNFKVNTPTNIEVRPNESVEIEIEWDGTPFNEGNLFINANPCLVQNNIRLVNYIGTTLITIKETEANPTEDAFVILDMKNTENFPYKGNRKFEATLSLDYEVFYPEKIISKYSKPKIEMNQSLNGDRREFVVALEGDFELEGELMKIQGKPGLSDEDSTHIQIISKDFFGKSVTTTYRPGKLRIINICGDRRILPLANIQTTNNYPNPFYNNLNIELESDFTNESEIELIIYSTTGTIVKKTRFNVNYGMNTLNLNLSELENGIYNILIEYTNNANSADSKNIKTIIEPIKVIKIEE